VNQSVRQRIAAGTPAAVQECIDEYGSLVWSLARRLSRARANADATQEIFLDIWQSACRFDPLRGSDRIMMIAPRRLIVRLRKTKIEPPMASVEALDANPASARDIALTSSLESAQVAHAFGALRPNTF
jgi:DNA-directed RNA polymerase specialized sigma24 family protein